MGRGAAIQLAHVPAPYFHFGACSSHTQAPLVERVSESVLTVAAMRARNFTALLPALLAAALAGCQDPDVGQACTIHVANLPATVPADWMETGNTGCVNLVCIASPDPSGSAKHNPYCSKACVSDRDCYSGQTGLICRQVVLDSEFLAALSEADRTKYLGDIQFSNYCALPLP